MKSYILMSLITLLSCNSTDNSKLNIEIESRYYKISTLSNPVILNVTTDPYTGLYKSISDSLISEFKNFHDNNKIIFKYDLNTNKIQNEFPELPEELYQKFPHYEVEKARLGYKNAISNIENGFKGIIFYGLQTFFALHHNSIITENLKLTEESSSEYIFKAEFKVDDKIYIEKLTFSKDNFKLNNRMISFNGNILSTERYDWISSENKFLVNTGSIECKKGTPLKGLDGKYQYAPYDRNSVIKFGYDFSSNRKFPLKSIAVADKNFLIEFE